MQASGATTPSFRLQIAVTAAEIGVRPRSSIRCRLSNVDGRLEPIERIRALSAASRDTALEHPHLYEVMTARPLPEYEPPAESRRLARATLQPLVDAVADAIEAGELEGEARQIAQQMWAAGHGFVSLVIHGLDTADDVDRRYAELTEAMIAGHRMRAQ